MMKLGRHTPEMVERYIREGHWSGPTISEQWDICAREYPDKEAIADSNMRLTYAQGKRWIDRVALGLKELGIKKDDIIPLQVPNRVEGLLTIHACEKIGALATYPPATMRHREMEHILGITEAVGVVIAAKYRNFDYYQMIMDIRPNLPSLKHILVIGDEVPPGTISINEMAQQPLEEKYPEDVFEETKIKIGESRHLGATSGTTGIPKIIFSPCMGSNPARYQFERFGLNSEDVVCTFAPFYGGVGYLARAVPYIHAKALLMEKFDPEQALALIEKERITVVCTVPAQLAMMLRHPEFDKYDLSSVRICYYAGSSCPYSLAEEIEERIDCVLLNQLGAVEAGSVCATSPLDPPDVRRTAAGKFFPGVEWRIIDEAGNDVPVGEIGELLVKGWGTNGGFYKDHEATRASWGDEADGYFHIGDRVKYDEEGNVYVVGREKDMIIRGGQNIYPGEVENILITNPKVLNVTVVSMPDPVMGEKCCAYVIPRPGQELTFDEMIVFLKEKKLAPFKLPERLEIVDSFPMSGDGQKVLKRALTEDITNKLKAEGKIE